MTKYFQGEPGLNGAPGIPGRNGTDGKIGEKGSPGLKGEAGEPVSILFGWFSYSVNYFCLCSASPFSPNKKQKHS